MIRSGRARYWLEITERRKRRRHAPQVTKPRLMWSFVADCIMPNVLEVDIIHLAATTGPQEEFVVEVVSLLRYNFCDLSGEVGSDSVHGVDIQVVRRKWRGVHSFGKRFV